METITLVNPFHDKLGRFAAKGGVVAFDTGVVTAIAGLVTSAIVKNATNNEIKRVKKELGVKQKEATEIVGKSYIISKKIAGKDVKMTYEQAQRGSSLTTKVGVNTAIGGLAVAMLGVSMHGSSRNRDYGYWNGQQRSKPKTASENQASWPKHATEADFKKMYRDLSKKHHPDIGGSTAVMQKINQYKDAKNWAGMEELHKLLEDLYVYMLEEGKHPIVQELAALMIKVIEQAIKDKSEYITIPVDEPIEPFVYEDGEIILDWPTMNLIYETYMGEQNAA